MNRLFYAAHRWLALVGLLQLLVWTGSGLFFAIVPIDRVRGEHTRQHRPEPTLPVEQLAPLPRRAMSQATIRMLDGRPIIVTEAQGERHAYDGLTGAALEITADWATRIARTDQLDTSKVGSIARVEAAEVEYRDKPLPAWLVTFDDGLGTRVYVDAVTGAITARRNSLWRVYDLLWALHIMDYRDRESFNHPLIVLFALAGVLTVTSGASLWVLRWRRKVVARKSARARDALAVR